MRPLPSTESLTILDEKNPVTGPIYGPGPAGGQTGTPEVRSFTTLTCQN